MSPVDTLGPEVLRQVTVGAAAAGVARARSAFARAGGWIACVVTLIASSRWIGEPRLSMAFWLLLLAALLVGQWGAGWMWTRRGAVFVPARWASPARLAVGVAGALWALLAFDIAQGTLHRGLIVWVSVTPWEGLAGPLVWTAIGGGAAALALAAVVLRRGLAHAVLQRRVDAVVLHDITWIGVALAIAALLSLNSTHGASLAQNLAVFADAVSAPMFLLMAVYSLVRWLLGRAGPGGPDPDPDRARTLLLMDMRGPADWSAADTRRLHAFGRRWVREHGAFGVVRPAAAVAHGGGTQLRWAEMAGAPEALFVDDPSAARRWAAAWSAAGAGWVGEVFAQRDGWAALASAQPAATHVVLVSATTAPALFDDVRHLLPRGRSSVVLTPSWREGSGVTVSRLSTLHGDFATQKAADAIFVTLASQARRPQSTWRLGIVGRARSDAVADALVLALDCTEDASGRLIDAERPPRGSAERCDDLLLLLDPALLAGQAEARADAAALATVVQAASTVSVVELGPQAPVEQVIAAARACGVTATFRYHGPIGPWDDGPMPGEADIARLVGDVRALKLAGGTLDVQDDKAAGAGPGSGTDEAPLSNAAGNDFPPDAEDGRAGDAAADAAPAGSGEVPAPQGSSAATSRDSPAPGIGSKPPPLVLLLSERGRVGMETLDEIERTLRALEPRCEVLSLEQMRHDNQGLAEFEEAVERAVVLVVLLPPSAPNLPADGDVSWLLDMAQRRSAPPRPLPVLLDGASMSAGADGTLVRRLAEFHAWQLDLRRQPQLELGRFAVVVSTLLQQAQADPAGAVSGSGTAPTGLDDGLREADADAGAAGEGAAAAPPSTEASDASPSVASPPAVPRTFVYAASTRDAADLCFEHAARVLVELQTGPGDTALVPTAAAGGLEFARACEVRGLSVERLPGDLREALLSAGRIFGQRKVDSTGLHLLLAGTVEDDPDAPWLDEAFRSLRPGAHVHRI